MCVKWSHRIGYSSSIPWGGWKNPLMTLGLLSIMLTAYYQYSTFNTFPYDAQHWSIFSHLLPACTTILSVNKRAKDSSAQGRGVQMLRAQTLFLGCEIWWIQTNQLFHSSQLTSVCVGIARQWEGSYYPSFTWERAEADNHLKYQLIFDCPFWPAFELACGENLMAPFICTWCLVLLQVLNTSTNPHSVT